MPSLRSSTTRVLFLTLVGASGCGSDNSTDPGDDGTPALPAEVVGTWERVMQEIMAERYPINEWNIYVFQFSDGDNWGDDNRRSLEMLTNDILPKTNQFCYGQVESPYGSGEYLKVLEDVYGREHEKLVLSNIEDRDGIYESIKTFLGKGR